MTEAFNLMSNTIFDNIVITDDNQDINLDDIWKSDLTSYNIDSIPLLPTLDDFCRINNIDLASTDTTNKPNEELELPRSEILHDCMWSGTCVDKSHPMKKKYYRYCAAENGNGEDSDMDLETELTLENNLPAEFQSVNQSIQNDPANVFQEIVQNASQSCRNYAQPAYRKPSTQQFPQQSFQNVPVYQNLFPAKMIDIKCEPTTSNSNLARIDNVKFEPIASKSFPMIPTKKMDIKCEPQVPNDNLSRMENVKFEPITTESYQMMPLAHPVPQMYFCKEEISQVMPYYPVNPIVMPQFYYPYPPEFDCNGNQICHVNENGYFKNIQFAVDHPKLQNQKQTKKKTQDKRKVMKKTKVKDRKSRLSVNDEICFGEGSNSHQRLRQSVGSDENPIEKRSMHNSMERQRRIGLKNLFIALKESIPTLDERERVPKVSILREAISYCEKLHSDEKLLEDLKKKHNKLMTQFHKLHKTMIKY